MAKNTVAQVCQKLLRVQGAMREGLSAAAACKAAGVTSGTWKRWQEAWAHLDLPRWVVEADPRGAVALSGDGRWVFAVADTPEGFYARRIDVETGGDDAVARYDAPRPPHVYREVIAATADAEGRRVTFVVTGGGIYTWDLARGAIAPAPSDLRGRGVALEGRASSGARRWSYAVVTPDLDHVAHWERLGDRETGVGARLVVRRLDDGREVFHHDTAPLFIAPALTLHPTRPWIAVNDDNSLLRVLDWARGEALVQGGPQLHGCAFGPGDTVLFNDWYHQVHALDVVTGESRPLARGWGLAACLGPRFLCAGESEIVVHGTGADARPRKIPFEGVKECLLSRDGRRLVVVADLLCGWDLGPADP